MSIFVDLFTSVGLGLFHWRGEEGEKLGKEGKKREEKKDGVIEEEGLDVGGWLAGCVAACVFVFITFR